MTFSVFFFFDRSFLISIPMIVLICLPQISMTIIPAFMWLRPPFSLCCGLVPLLTGEKNIYLVIYLFPREEACLHKNLYYISIKGTVVLLKCPIHQQDHRIECLFNCLYLQRFVCNFHFLLLLPALLKKRDNSLCSSRTYQHNYN